MPGDDAKRPFRTYRGRGDDAEDPIEERARAARRRRSARGAGELDAAPARPEPPWSDAHPARVTPPARRRGRAGAPASSSCRTSSPRRRRPAAAAARTDARRSHTPAPRRPPRAPRRRRRWGRLITLAVLGVLLVLALWIGYGYWQYRGSLDAANKRVDAADARRARPRRLTALRPLHHARARLRPAPRPGPGRSDSILLVRVDPARNRIVRALDPARPPRHDPRPRRRSHQRRLRARRPGARHPHRAGADRHPDQPRRARRLLGLPRARRRARRRHDRQPREDHLEQLRRTPLALRPRQPAPRRASRARLRTGAREHREPVRQRPHARSPPAARPAGDRPWPGLADDALQAAERGPLDRQAAHDRPLGQRHPRARLAADAHRQHVALSSRRHDHLGRRRERIIGGDENRRVILAVLGKPRRSAAAPGDTFAAGCT